MRTVTSSVLRITRPTVLLDWRPKSRATSITIAPGCGSIYLGVVGLSRIPERTVRIRLGTGSSIMAHSIVIGNDSQKLSSTITIEHRGSNSTSRSVFRGVLGGRATATLNGMIHITTEGQRSDARLDERVLLLSPEAKAETIPNLEIEADDVKASHAATVSRLSDDELFYLATRGFTHAQSTWLLLESFLLSQLSHLPESRERASLEMSLRDKLTSIIGIV